MTDRELLEMAAKAAGVTIRYNSIGTQDARCHWNPLEDDGAALRLAMQLGMCVTSFPITGDTMVSYRPFCDCRSVEENWGDDPDAATRRAIVRAAAEIGSRQ